jgi:hypothetical protein
VAAQADERAAGHVAEAEGAHRPHPEVEVLREAEVAAVAADGLVDAAVDHARRVDERVVLAHEVAQQLVARAVLARPRAALHALAVDDRRGAVGHARVGVPVEDATWRAMRSGSQTSSSPSMAMSSPRPSRMIVL